MKIHFLGAIREVTGSNYLIETNNQRIVVDCGYFQGSRENRDKNFAGFAFDPKTIDAVILTHAHLDHCGRLPKLIKEGFAGKIYATAPSKDLAEIVLEDTLGLMEEDEKLFSEADVVKTQQQIEPVEYHQRKEILQNVSMVFFDAGHILGSVFVLLEIEGKRVIFSGDVGNPPVPILQPTESLPGADVLITESTYGGRLHENPSDREQKLVDNILPIIQNSGTVMIPSFAIERTQEVLYELNNIFHQRKLPAAPFFLDSPMAIRTTEVFERYAYLWNKEAQGRDKHIGDVFEFPNLEMTLTTEQSKKINNVAGAKVIIAGAGMMEGGRILHHAKRYLPDPKNALLIVGYQVEGTLGRELLDGAKSVKIHQERIAVRARIKAIGGYSAHADQQYLVKWIDSNTVKSPQIFITHGELGQSEMLKQVLEKQGYRQTIIPEPNQVSSI